MNRKDTALLKATGAWDAARAAAWEWQAGLLRQWISWDEVERAIAEYVTRAKA